MVTIQPSLQVQNPGSPWPARLHAYGAGVLAGLVTGLFCGVLWRLAMVVTAVMADDRVSWSVGGTSVVVGMGAVLGMPSGLWLAAARNRLMGSPLRRGLMLAIFLSVAFGLPYLWAAPMGLNTHGSKLVNQLMYGAMFPLQGVLLGLAAPRWRWW